MNWQNRHPPQACDGVERLELRNDGTLILYTALGAIEQSPPLTWMELRDGVRIPLDCHYRLLGPQSFGFRVPGWDGISPLTIDPGLVWLSHLGGSGDDYVKGVAVDADGTLVVAGSTSSTNFPPPGRRPGALG